MQQIIVGSYWLCKWSEEIVGRKVEKKNQRIWASTVGWGFGNESDVLPSPAQFRLVHKSEWPPQGSNQEENGKW